MSVFMDQAEEMGVRPVLEAIARHYSGRDGFGTSPCTCDYTVGDAWRSPLSMSKTHDLSCPLHRIVVLCGNVEDRQALVNKAHEFALVALRIVAQPAHETVEDHEYAKSIVGLV